MKRRLSVKVCPVKGCLLSYKDQFPDTAGCHGPGFFQKVFHRNTAVAAAQLRDNAVGAVLVTSLGNFQVFIIASGGDDPPTIGFRDTGQLRVILVMAAAKHIFDREDDAVVAVGSQHGVHLRNFLMDLFAVTLRHTACDKQYFAASLLFVLSHLEDVFNALFLGVMDEAAGIDDNDVRLCFIVCDLITVLYQQAEHVLGVHKVFVTAKGNK